MRCLLCLFLYIKGLLCVAGDEMVTLQEVEGTTITLHTGITGIQSDAQVQWFYGPEKAEKMILNSLVYKGETSTEISEKFKERLQLDRISGALTIRNISRNHSGVYLLHVITGRLLSRTFSVSVYAPVFPPFITRHSVHDPSASVPTSGSRCSVLCSVECNRGTTLSWVKGSELLNQTSDSHDGNNLTLPLDVNVEELDVYSCVSANPISNHTVTLNITEICSQHTGKRECCGFIEFLIRSVCSVLVLAAISAILIHHYTKYPV